MAAVSVFLSHPVYGPLTVAETQEAVGRLLGEVRTMVGAGTALGERSLPPPLPTREQHYFSKLGPQCHTTYCVLAPDSSLLSPALLALGRERDLESLLCPAFDPEQRCGVAADREAVLSLRTWLQHRLSHVAPGGPGDSAYFLLTMFVHLEVNKILSKFGEGGSGRWGELARFPGTSDYYYRLQSALFTATELLGAPTHLFTDSMNTQSPECLAAWVSLTQGSPERPVKVWRRKDEVLQLTRLPGTVVPGEDGDYYTHTRRVGEGGLLGEACPYHDDCRREPLEAWRAR